MPAGRIWLACRGLRSAREDLTQVDRVDSEIVSESGSEIVSEIVVGIVRKLVRKSDCRGTGINLKPASFALGWELASVIGNSPDEVSCEWEGGKDAMRCPSQACAGQAHVCTSVYDASTPRSPLTGPAGQLPFNQP